MGWKFISFLTIATAFVLTKEGTSALILLTFSSWIPVIIIIYKGFTDRIKSLENKIEELRSPSLD